MPTNWPLMKHRGPAIGEADLVAFEQRLGCSLPEDYRRFLLEVNGGFSADENARFQYGVLHRLFSLGDKENESNDLEICTGWARAVVPHPDLLLIGYAEVSRSCSRSAVSTGAKSGPRTPSIPGPMAPTRGPRGMTGAT